MDDSKEFGQYLAGGDIRPFIEGTERYRSLFTHNPHAIFSLDLEGNFTAVNPAAEVLSGFTGEELVEMHFFDVISAHDHERIMGLYLEVVAGEPRQTETILTHKDGRSVDLHLLAVPVILDGAVAGVHGVAQDVTSRNRVAVELLEARRVAEEANEAKSVFLANMSHELRTPLTTLLAAAEMLEDSELDGVQSKFVQAMLRNGARLQSLIENILDITRIESKALTLRPEIFDLRALLDETVAWGRGQANAKGLPFDVHIDPELAGSPVADRERLTQVLTNLIDNAVKFTECGRIGFSAELVNGFEEDEEPPTILRARIRDTGTGIPAELQTRVFDPFAQADTSLTRRYEGAGLGLAICREMVELMGGTLELESREGQGTEACVTVPLGKMPA